MTDDTIAASDRFSVSDDVVLERIEDELVLLDLQRDTYFSVNAVGAVVWETLSEGGSVGEAVDAVLAEYDVDRARAGGDVETFVGMALEKGLIAREAE